MGPRGSRRCRLALLLTLGAALLVAVAALLLALARPRCAQPRYPRAAVAADTLRCSRIGRDILLQKGSAVDAAIAALVCTSVVNPQSMGLGGGVIFTIYNASTGEVEVINARETAPTTVAQNLLNECRESFLPGAKWIAVPGELRGYEAAHRRYGRLPWKALFNPTIKFLEPGIEVPEVLSRFLGHKQLQQELRNSSLSKLFLRAHGEILKTGETLHWPALVETLRAVAEHGAKEFYSGETARKLVDDVQKQVFPRSVKELLLSAGKTCESQLPWHSRSGSLTLDDLRSYQVRVVKAPSISLGNYIMYSAPEPAAGPIVFFILNVLKGFNFTKESMSTPSGRATAYHRIAEALKFAKGQTSKTEDPKFSRVEEGKIHELISDAFAAQARQQFDDRGDHPASHYHLTQRRMGAYGTSHVSVLAEDGSAVSVTSTINHPFGSMVYSDQTGIILNNELADFCMKQSNRTISPGEMPPSSMAPSILISRDRQSKLVIGGSGGQLIVPAVALAIANKLWFGYDLDGAIEVPLLFATAAGSLEFEKGFSQDVVAELRKRGHTIREAIFALNVVQGISKDGSCIFPYSDRRKNGMASGY